MARSAAPHVTVVCTLLALLALLSGPARAVGIRERATPDEQQNLEKAMAEECEGAGGLMQRGISRVREVACCPGSCEACTMQMCSNRDANIRSQCCPERVRANSPQSCKLAGKAPCIAGAGNRGAAVVAVDRQFTGLPKLEQIRPREQPREEGKPTDRGEALSTSRRKNLQEARKGGEVCRLGASCFKAQPRKWPDSPCPAASAEPSPVCAVMPVDPSRFWEVMPRLSRSWTGTVAAGVLTTGGTSPDFLAQFTAEGMAARGVCDPSRVSVSLLDSSPFVPLGERYPLNVLRNNALDLCDTPYVVLLDADFEVYPRVGQARLLAAATRLLDAAAAKGRNRAVVLPSFEVLDDAMAVQWRDAPVSVMQPWGEKKRLPQLLSQDKVVPFHWVEFPSGTHATNYQRWFKGSAPYAARYNLGYEPYVVLRREQALRFDETFVGRGFNKVAYLHELAAARFEYVVQPSLYVVHTHVHIRGTGGVTVGKENAAEAKALADIKSRVCTNKASMRYNRVYVGMSCVPAFLKRLKKTYGQNLMEDPEAYRVGSVRKQAEQAVSCLGGCAATLQEMLKGNTTSPWGVVRRGVLQAGPGGRPSLSPRVP